MRLGIPDPHDGGPCDCDWSKPQPGGAAWLEHRPLKPPDQRRYGTATTDPLGREAPDWHKGKHGLPVRTKTPTNGASRVR